VRAVSAFGETPIRFGFFTFGPCEADFSKKLQTGRAGF